MHWIPKFAMVFLGCTSGCGVKVQRTAILSQDAQFALNLIDDAIRNLIQELTAARLITDEDSNDWTLRLEERFDQQGMLASHANEWEVSNQLFLFILEESQQRWPDQSKPAVAAIVVETSAQSILEWFVHVRSKIEGNWQHLPNGDQLKTQMKLLAARKSIDLEFTPERLTH